MNFWKAFSQRIIKWWRVNVVAVFKLDYKKIREEQAQAMNAELYASTDMPEVSVSEDDTAEAPVDTSGGFHEAEIPEGTSADAMEVLNRINREKEEARRQEIDAERKKREEEDRIASILNKNKNDVSAFIAEGKQMAEEEQTAVESAPAEETAAPASSGADADEAAEQLRRAQEIIDRLNREAAEDEAKKQAEIDAAKAAAHDAGLS